MKMQPFESQEERLWQNKDRPWLLYKDTLAKKFFGKNCSVGCGAQFFTLLKRPTLLIHNMYNKRYVVFNKENVIYDI